MMHCRQVAVLLSLLLLPSIIQAQDESSTSKSGRIYIGAARAMVRVHWAASSGAESWTADQLGILVSRDGLIMTAGYLRKAQFITGGISVFFDADTEVQAQYVGKDQDLDVAFLKVTLPAKDAPEPLDLATVGSLSPGDEVSVVGLLDASFRYQPAIMRVHVMANAPSPMPHHVIDTELAPYSSFAPVFNRAGQVCAFAIPGRGMGALSRSGGGRFCLAIPAARLLPLIKQPPQETAEREKRQGWLGIVMQAFSPDLAEYWGLPNAGGIVVSQVLDGSAAQAAKLEVGDVIVKFANQPVNVQREEDLNSFTRMVKSAPLSEALPLSIYRNRKPMEIAVTLGERPRESLYEERHEDKLFGLLAQELTVNERVALGIAESVRGVIILQIQSGSWSDLGRLEPGDIVIQVNGKKVEKLPDFKEEMAASAKSKARRILLLVQRGSETAFLSLNPQWDMAPVGEERQGR